MKSSGEDVVMVRQRIGAQRPLDLVSILSALFVCQVSGDKCSLWTGQQAGKAAT
jgi:hypothetical protein